MLKSRLTMGVYVFTAACFLATWAYSQAPLTLKKPAATRTSNPFGSDSAVSVSTDDLPLLNPDANPKAPKSSRIMFEANWKNVQVGSKPMYFRQGDKSFVWAVKNTGDNPVDVGDDYGFAIAPGEEDFIVDTRLMLSVAAEKTTTVEVKASRVMTQGELTQESQPTPAAILKAVPGTPYGQPAIPDFGPSATFAPTDTFGPASQKPARPAPNP
jgi:urease beta subunit